MVNRAERISKAISDKGLSYTELEKVTGVSKSALQRYATGQTKKIPIDVIEAIAAATGVSARYLMGWDEENAPAEKGESVPFVFISYSREDEQAIADLLRSMSDEELKQTLDYARYLHGRSHEESK